MSDVSRHGVAQPPIVFGCHMGVAFVSRLAALTGVAAALCTLNACSSVPRPTGDPDPGHRMLNTLKPVLAVIPPAAEVQYKHIVEPIWDSCDGKRSTYGWNVLDVDAAFISALPAAAIQVHVRQAMAALGWRERSSDTEDEPPGLVWTRTLPGGETAQAVLTTEPDRGVWSLSASAPPAVHPVTGC